MAVRFSLILGTEVITSTTTPVSVMSVASAVDSCIATRSKIIVVPNMGNAGDALINHAMYSLLRRRGVPFSVVEAHELTVFDRTATYVVMANGALHDAEHPLDLIIRRLARAAAQIILFSATIATRDELLAELPADTIIVAREHVTHAYVTSARPDLTCLLSEDATMAIADGDADLPDPASWRLWQYRLRTALKAGMLKASAGFIIAPKRYARHSTFFAMRDDAEKISGRTTRSENVDLSLVVGTRQQTELCAEACAAVFLEILRSKRAVRTDRLHVSIGCCLVGVQCFLSANSYFKCRAIYEHSLSRRFPQLIWVSPDAECCEQEVVNR